MEKIKIKTSSWHYKLIDWSNDAFSSIPQNLCPYMRMLTKSIITSPIRFIWRHSPEYFTFHHDWATKHVIIFGLMIHGIFSLMDILPNTAMDMEWWYGWAACGVVAAIGAPLYAGFYGICEWLDRREERKQDGCVEPSLVSSYLKAKHDKVCPGIDFVGDEK